MVTPFLDELVDLYIRAGVSRLRPTVHELRITFIFLNGWKTETKEELYFITCENYIEFKFQCP